MSAMITADWFTLGRDVYYRKYELYCMGWQNEINLNDMMLYAAPYGGPIALMRNYKKIIRVQGSTNPIIYIYTSSGQKNASIVWSGSNIITLGWSDAEKLICVQEDGNVTLYDIFGTFLHTFSMGTEAKDLKVKDAKIFLTNSGTGVAVMTSACRIFIINNIEEPKIRKLPELPSNYLGSKATLYWTVLSEDRNTMAIVSCGHEIYALYQDKELPLSRELNLSTEFTHICGMAVSLNNKHIAIYTDSGTLWLGSLDLQKGYCEIKIDEPDAILQQLVWCGTEAVIGLWSNILYVVGRNGDVVQYPYDNIHLIPEIDGVRMISEANHEMIQKVPSVVQQIFRINSTDPGSYLLEASKQFQRRNHRADEYITLVKDQLPKAVAQCLEAAVLEFDTSTQKMLIRAAYFGKGFINGHSPKSYVEMCRILRVLNAVRDRRVGIPLTYTQFECLTAQVLLDRLVLRKHYYLAIQIAKYLKLSEKGILAHWARHKVIQSKVPPEIVAKEIAEKVSHNPREFSFWHIAKYAADNGRKDLAIKLLDHEVYVEKQVSSLLTLDQGQSALIKAIESGDTDLVYAVIIDIQSKTSLSKFQMIIRNFQVAQSLYLKYSQGKNREALRDIYIQEDDYNSQAALYITESLEPKNSTTRDTVLSAAQEAFKKARNEIGVTLCDETRKLYKYQRRLEEKFERSFMGLSIHQTAKALLKLQQIKLADNFKSEYKIPDRRYWWLRIESYAENDEWSELEKFSKARKSPVGYEPFIDVCLKYNNIFEAQKYVSRCKDDLKVKYYVKLKMLDKAAQIAFEQKDVQSLLFVQAHCGTSNNTVAELTKKYIEQLAAK
ncbi:vacuolar protein sorting-associated protein 16 homolog [Ctenocephalides felis]|uniref:vacuolar protein sorting-associated protein 16 homolog n=1 Tax=Ctenocephalides felis TaxID=7515 RepID=UPI000E6E51FB|nr:vacuolar protein sorting-associated protein 16 homolog [Ctenocephalides felis]